MEGNKSEDALYLWNPYILKTWNSYQLFFDKADRAEKSELSFKIFKPLLKLSSQLENVILFDVFSVIVKILGRLKESSCISWSFKK